MLPQDAEGLDHLVELLAEADHPRPDLVIRFHPSRGPGEDLAERRNFEPRRALRVKPRHRLDVVVEDIGTLVDHPGQGHLPATEVRGQDLDRLVRAWARIERITPTKAEAP